MFLFQLINTSSQKTGFQRLGKLALFKKERILAIFLWCKIQKEMILSSLTGRRIGWVHRFSRGWPRCPISSTFMCFAAHSHTTHSVVFFVLARAFDGFVGRAGHGGCVRAFQPRADAKRLCLLGNPNVGNE
jgi:hypothetical protein